MKFNHRAFMKAKIASIITSTCEKDIEERPQEYLALLNLRKTRNAQNRFVARDKHPWILLLKNPETRDPSSMLGRRFRLRFRVPLPFFLDWLVPTAQEVNLFDISTNPNGGTRAEQIPLVIKLLISLRILGRGVTQDDISEPSYVSESHCGAIFRKFITNFSRLFKDEFIKLPTPSELESSMKAYAAVGFPGCVGSIDCTHIRWWNCPSKHRNSCHGKEGYPSLGFQMIVDPSKRIQYVSQAYFGTLNDQNICDVDPIIYNDTSGILNVARDRQVLYKDVAYDLYDENGNIQRIKGGYLISDGGYPPLSVFMNPNCRRFDTAAVYWSEFLESVRKDVECTFGIVKSRFRGLMLEAAVHSACILHNMLHTIDGFDINNWENDDIWEQIHPDGEDIDTECTESGNRRLSLANLSLHLEPIKAMNNKPRVTKTIVIPVGNVNALQRYVECLMEKKVVYLLIINN